MSTASGDDYLVAGESPALVVVPEPRVSQWPFLLVTLVGLSGLAFIALGRLQQGVLGLLLAVALASALRLVLPTRTAGWLTSRSRVVDAAGFAALAVGLAATLFLLK